MMKHLLTVVAALALCVPAAALAADPTPNASQLALQSCKTQQTQMGATFKTTYGTNATKSNAMGKCVSKAMQAAQAALQNAAETCKAQSTDAGFAGTHGGKTFDAFYGNAKGKNADANAMGKCVSSTAQAANAARTAALVTAAKTCKAERTAGATAFAAKYHTFGACVSKQAKG